MEPRPPLPPRLSAPLPPRLPPPLLLPTPPPPQLHQRVNLANESKMTLPMLSLIVFFAHAFHTQSAKIRRC